MGRKKNKDKKTPPTKLLKEKALFAIKTSDLDTSILEGDSMECPGAKSYASVINTTTDREYNNNTKGTTIISKYQHSMSNTNIFKNTNNKKQSNNIPYIYIFNENIIMSRFDTSTKINSRKKEGTASTTMKNSVKNLQTIDSQVNLSHQRR